MDRIEPDKFESLGAITERIVNRHRGERVWDGKPITAAGTYSGISLADYHENRDLFDGPSVSKSAIKWMIPTHGGSPKAFWGRWKWNPDHIEPKPTEALDFGKAVHCLLLGDEPFHESFAIRPKEFPDYRSKAAQEWRDETVKARKTIVTLDQMKRIRRIHDDASTYPLIQLGVLNGRIERTMCVRDEETGIWLKVRPDAVAADGIYADLKTASKFDEDFLERQAFDAGYYLQAAMVRMVCRQLRLPFETFTLIYVLNDDVPDTAHVEISPHELDRGERAVRWCLRVIKHGLETGEWPGARPFNGGERHLQIKQWAKERLDHFLDLEEAA
jgi:hypothetical protein